MLTFIKNNLLLFRVYLCTLIIYCFIIFLGVFGTPQKLSQLDAFDNRVYVVMSLAIIFTLGCIYYSILRVLQVKTIEKLIGGYPFIVFILSIKKLIDKNKTICTVIFYKLFDKLSDRISISFFMELADVLSLLKNDFRLHFIILTMILPRLITSSIFIIEVIYFRELKYFYSSLILLAIPLVTNIILYMIDHSLKSYMTSYEFFFKFEDISEEQFIVSRKEYENPEISYYQSILEQNVGFYYDTLNFLYDDVIFYIMFQMHKNKYWLYIVQFGLLALGFIFYVLILIGIY